MLNTPLHGHLIAAFTITVWGITFISTKILLAVFSPFEILAMRFALGYMALWLACPRQLPWQGVKHEVTFALGGLTGILIYFLMENYALVLAPASNVGIFVSLAPFFTVLFAHCLASRREPLHRNYFVGLVISMMGVVLIGYNGLELGRSPLGDLCALGAAAMWGVYVVITRNIASLGYNIIVATRRIFFYSLVAMLPVLGWLDFNPPWQELASISYLGNMLFLGLVASALCYVTWNRTVAILGALKASAYIYGIPVITVITAYIVLDEAITLTSGTGAILTLTGLVIAERKERGKTA